MFILSFKIINENQKITIDWSFFLKNTIFIGIWGIIIYLIKNNLFILEDIYRYTNLLYLIIIWLIFWIYLGIVNRKEVWILKREILKIKK
jgi:hypothetical protein